MSADIVGVFHNPWERSYDQHKSLAQLYRRAIWLKANPRDAQYMGALFRERYPEGRLITPDTDLNWQKHLSSAKTIVLLYPDSIGLGFERLESVVERAAMKWTTVRILNGRRRDFVRSKRARRALRWRRLIEQTMLGEALAIVVFLAVTPFFVVSDFIRGRR